ncbi:MAG: tRNA-specific adenosine deaminase [Buchnera aphidicola (Periphyllus lyropictus)]|uniref:tRNA adenosine(34) deaminase TadA n=1 Tax=Buchnera aphidicola TaxID=9 RepID=UPI001EBE5585|nr:tRNA adenosine(34) deaminase TadA [Buchnera aphidicola]NIH16622.1 tRNA-specific adenosine deaminase [Buchnera aphidicola (Periphyllus lyropictus)]USS94534.1 tRNA adenosine(34) deaminase TadA [Buchnera aphidicola (Periphyllus lyropictus)]
MNSKKKHENWMRISLLLANIAYNQGEVPVGSLLINSKKIIGIGWNSSINNNNPTSHAEIIALSKGGKFLKNYRLLKSTLYVTLEPCLMCLGAILHSRINKLVIGAKNYKNYNKIFYDINDILNFKNKKIKIIKNVLKKECSILLKQFFYKKRS